MAYTVVNKGAYVNQYKQTAVTTSSPLQLVIMLYDGAIRFMDAGKTAITAGQRQEQNEFLQKAQRIISELTACLDMEQGGDVARNLFALYSFAYAELVTANITDSTENVDNAQRVMTELRESWVALEQQQRSGESQESLRNAS